jgi:hypothetical protein
MPVTTGFVFHARVGQHDVAVDALWAGPPIVCQGALCGRRSPALVLALTIQQPVPPFASARCGERLEPGEGALERADATQVPEIVLTGTTREAECDNDRAADVDVT